MALSPAAATDLKAWKAYVETVELYQLALDGIYDDVWASKKMRQKASWLIDMSKLNFAPGTVKAYTDGLEIKEWKGDAIPEDVQENLARLESLVDDEAFGTGDAYVICKKYNGTVQPHFQRANSVWPVVSSDEPGKLFRATKFAYLPELKKFQLQLIDDTNVTTYYTLKDYKEQTAIPVNPNAWGDGVTAPHGFSDVPVLWWKNSPVSQWSHGRAVIRDILLPMAQYHKLSADSLKGSEDNIFRIAYMMGINPEDLMPKWNEATKAYEPPRMKFDDLKQSILLTSGTGPAGTLEGPNLEYTMKQKDQAKQEIAIAGGLPVYYWTEAPSNVSKETVEIFERRIINARKSYQKEVRPVWRGLLKLMGYNASPSWDEVATVEPVVASPVLETNTDITSSETA